MVDVESARPAPSASPIWLRSRFGLIVLLLGLMWVIELIDVVFLSDRLERQGIVPRTVDGIDGILWSPFLHGGIGHLLSNTVPFAILSGLVLTRGLRRYVNASLIIVGIGGLLVWLFAIGGNENHIGASGWVFGLFGYLVGSAWFERRPGSIVAAVVAIVLYGTTVLFGFLPRSGVSWEGHVFGLLAGVIAARVLSSTYARVNGFGRDDTHQDHRR